jgi:hypothetical protein
MGNWNSPDFGFQDFERTMNVNGRFVRTGSMFCNSRNGCFSYNVKEVQVPEGNRIFLACISLNMLSPVGGDFNQDDTIYADIFEIDGTDTGLSYNNGGTGLPGNHPRDWFEAGYSPFLGDFLGGLGGAWGHHFGPVPYKSASNNQKMMRISTYLGEIQKHITFRLSVNGDDWAGASYFVMQI